MPKTCENWLGFVCVYYAQETRGIHKVLPYSADFKAPGKLWVLSECSFIWNKRPVNIRNDHKYSCNLYIGHINIFPIFYIESIRPWSMSHGNQNDAQQQLLHQFDYFKKYIICSTPASISILLDSLKKDQW